MIEFYGTFGDAFVHDLISYNFADFSYFLDIMKNETNSKKFTEYYNILTKMFGENAETMQRAMSEYQFNANLLDDIRDIELTDEQYTNLLKVLGSRCNRFNIQTIEQLNDFDNIANGTLKKEIEACGNDTILMKRKLFENLFGVSYDAEDSTNRSQEYGEDVRELISIYDFVYQEDDDKFSETEKRLIDILQFLDKESEPSRILEIYQQCIKEKDIRNPVLFTNLIKKIKVQTIEEANKKLVSNESLDEIAKEDETKEEKRVWIEDVNGLSIYHLNMPILYLATNLGKANLNFFMNYEGQKSNNAICCRISRSSDNKNERGFLVFGNLDDDSVITSFGSDAKTTWENKRIKMHGTHVGSSSLITNIDSIDTKQYDGNETSIYRRKRSHSDISNENGGGRIKPTAVIAGDSAQWLDEDLKEECKKYGIPIYVFESGSRVKPKEIDIKENSYER